MQQLTGHDAAFLALERADVALHGAGLFLLQPTSAITRGDLMALLVERLHLVPALHRRLVTVPLGLDLPYWLDAEVDLDSHVQELWLRPGTDERGFLNQVARLHARPLHRERPLWELHLLHGVPGGRQAVLLKVHHAVLDGVGGVHLLDALLDTDADGRAAAAGGTPLDLQRPSPLALLARGATSAAQRPLRAGRLVNSLLRSAPAVLREPTRRRLPLLDRFRGAQGTEGLSTAPLRGPATPFNRPVGRDRTLVTASLPMPDVLAARTSLDATVNDIVVGVCAGALRRWLAESDALPDAPLIAATPASFRAPEAAAAGGNHFSLLLAVLPTDVDDRIERMHAAAASMRGAKRTYGALPPSLLTDATSLVFPPVLSAASAVAARLALLEHVRPCNLVLSSVRGPREPRWLCGARVAAYYPLSQVIDGQALSITALSWDQELHLGLVADAGVPLPLGRLGELLVDELSAVLAAVVPASVAHP